MGHPTRAFCPKPILQSKYNPSPHTHVQGATLHSHDLTSTINNEIGMSLRQVAHAYCHPSIWLSWLTFTVVVLGCNPTHIWVETYFFLFIGIYHIPPSHPTRVTRTMMEILIKLICFHYLAMSKKVVPSICPSSLVMPHLPILKETTNKETTGRGVDNGVVIHSMLIPY